MNYDDLIKKESLKKTPIADWQMIQRLLSRSRKDLRTARKNLDDDEPAALDLVYKSMFHAANALIQSQGYRPGRIQQHLGVVEAVKRTFGSKARSIILKFDNLRQKRNEFEYQALYRGTRTEIINGFKDAEMLIAQIEKYIEAKNPQKKLKF